MPWATVAKVIIEATSNTAENVFDIMALSDFFEWRALFVQTESLLQSNQNLQITNGSDSDGQVSF